MGQGIPQEMKQTTKVFVEKADLMAEKSDYINGNLEEITKLFNDSKEKEEKLCPSAEDASVCGEV